MRLGEITAHDNPSYRSIDQHANRLRDAQSSSLHLNNGLIPWTLWQCSCDMSSNGTVSSHYIIFLLIPLLLLGNQSREFKGRLAASRYSLLAVLTDRRLEVIKASSQQMQSRPSCFSNACLCESRGTWRLPPLPIGELPRVNGSILSVKLQAKT